MHPISERSGEEESRVEEVAMGMDLGAEMERRDREDEEEKKRDLTLLRSPGS